jgi:AmmeMemoRadiSam system protein B
MPDDSLRRAQLAGQWYPGDGAGVSAMLERWRPYSEAGPDPSPGPASAAMAPHAGWFFSGQLAAKAIRLASLALGPDGPALVAVLGGHLPPGAGVIAYGEARWETPAGPLEMAGDLNDALPPPLKPRLWRGPTNDNTIEVQLPLVKHYCPRARIWPLRVASGGEPLALGALLAEMAGRLEGAGGLMVLASTDLTHYGQAYGFEPAGPGPAGERFRLENDRIFLDAALKPDPRAMMEAGEARRAACSAGAAAAAAEMAVRLGLRAELIDHYASGDIRPGDQCVGYGAVSWLAPRNGRDGGQDGCQDGGQAGGQA